MISEEQVTKLKNKNSINFLYECRGRQKWMESQVKKNYQKGNKIAGKTNYKKKIYVYIDMVVDIEIDLIEM